MADPARLFVLAASLMVTDGLPPREDPALLEHPLAAQGNLQIVVTYSVIDNQLTQTGVVIGATP